MALPSIRRPPSMDVAIAALATVFAQLEIWISGHYEPAMPHALAGVAMTVPLLWRRRAPLAVLALALTPLLVTSAAGGPLDSTFVPLTLLVASHAVGAYSAELRSAVAGLTLGIAMVGASFALERWLGSNLAQPPGLSDFLYVGGIMGAVWLLGVLLGDRSRQVGDLRAHARAVERERDERARIAVAEERARIARELHDVVAHSVSVTAVQAGSMRRRLGRRFPEETEELVAVEQASRQAMAEMRRLLGLLRADGEGAPSLSPQPGIGAVPELVEQVRGSGVSVELSIAGCEASLPAGLELAAYRVVQEALTNVLKHAPGARTDVLIRRGERELEVRVEDDGPGATGESRPGEGHGLIGIRERVDLYGGRLEIGGGPNGGFTVRARLPLET